MIVRSRFERLADQSQILRKSITSGLSGFVYHHYEFDKRPNEILYNILQAD